MHLKTLLGEVQPNRRNLYGCPSPKLYDGDDALVQDREAVSVRTQTKVKTTVVGRAYRDRRKLLSILRIGDDAASNRLSRDI